MQIFVNQMQSVLSKPVIGLDYIQLNVKFF